MIILCQEHRLEHRTKHIALRYFLARELQQRGQLRLAYVASQANTADIFTKALLPGDHQRFSTVLACFAFFDWFCDHLFSPTLLMGIAVMACHEWGEGNKGGEGEIAAGKIASSHPSLPPSISPPIPLSSHPPLFSPILVSSHPSLLPSFAPPILLSSHPSHPSLLPSLSPPIPLSSHPSPLPSLLHPPLLPSLSPPVHLSSLPRASQGSQ
ncbi:unnamed protein product [Closterium sp. NIES-53]